MKPRTRIRLAMRAALRRRYGYAALNALRRGVRAAMREHVRRSLDASRPYDGGAELTAIRAAYRRALTRLQSLWPSLLVDDERVPRRRRRRRRRLATITRRAAA